MTNYTYDEPPSEPTVNRTVYLPEALNTMLQTVAFHANQTGPETAILLCKLVLETSFDGFEQVPADIEQTPLHERSLSLPISLNQTLEQLAREHLIDWQQCVLRLIYKGVTLAHPGLCPDRRRAWLSGAVLRLLQGAARPMCLEEIIAIIGQFGFNTSEVKLVISPYLRLGVIEFTKKHALVIAKGRESKRSDQALVDLRQMQEAIDEKRRLETQINQIDERLRRASYKFLAKTSQDSHL